MKTRVTTLAALAFVFFFISARGPTNGDTTNIIIRGGTGGASYFGPSIKTEGLGNTPLGSTIIDPNGQVWISIRFSPTHTGKLAAVRSMTATRVGYAKGNGGTIQVQLQTDDGTPKHFPSGTVLATYRTGTGQGRAVFDPTRNGGDFVKTTFASAASITAGKLYHLVYHNIDASPTTNWLSLDFIYNDGQTMPVQPSMSDTNLAALIKYGARGWQTFASLYVPPATPTPIDHTPVIALYYVSGAIEGRFLNAGVETAGPSISGNAKIRDQLFLRSHVTFKGISIYAQRNSGSDPLTVQIIRDSDSGLISSATFGSASFPTSHKDYFLTANVPTATLMSGTTYNLVFSTPATSSYFTWPWQYAYVFPSYPYPGDAAQTWRDSQAQDNVTAGMGVWGPLAGNGNLALQWWLSKK